jgi:ABC-2 type transport system permease protein
MKSSAKRRRALGFSRFAAMFAKEFIQLKRDRVTFATMIIVPLMQLLLFGFAINTNPRHLPTAVLLQEQSDIGRAIIAALQNTGYFNVTRMARTSAELDGWIKSGDVLFGVEIPANFARDVRRGENPSMLVVADASDPVAAGTALGALDGIVSTALRGIHAIPADRGTVPPFTIISQRRYNPAAVTSLNIVPGLLGTILTMTMLIFTSLSVTREVERGTMESLLAMPIEPLQIMLGKITPYIVVGFVQAAIILVAGVTIFSVPIEGSLALLVTVTVLFVTATLSVGYTFSTIARNQLQAIQMSMMFFLPNILLSGFMFPFSGMPGWAQAIGQMLPLTHYLRTVRGIMLKGAETGDLTKEIIWLAALMLAAMAIAVTRFRRTLD